MNVQNNTRYLRFKDICDRYNLKEKEMRSLWKLVKPIFCHVEFQKRLQDPFLHHQDVYVGEHILGDTILAYKVCKKKNKDADFIRRTVLISMFHDLYVQSWMIYNPKKHFINSHAFLHPIEAIINAITWFPEYFLDVEDAKIIIDGVLHHMYPCPVRAFTDLEMELPNYELYEALDNKYKMIIECSLVPCMFRNMSLRRSFYVEGRILSHVDKVITMKKDLKGKKAFGACKTLFLAVAGRNKVS